MTRMFKVLSKEHGKIVCGVNFHTLTAAINLAEAETGRGYEVELCDMETSRLMSTEALRSKVGTLRRVSHG